MAEAKTFDDEEGPFLYHEAGILPRWIYDPRGVMEGNIVIALTIAWEKGRECIRGAKIPNAVYTQNGPWPQIYKLVSVNNCERPGPLVLG